MTYLAYGILPEQKVCQSCLPRGLIGEPLSAANVDGLTIVFASVPVAAAQPAVPMPN
jgi:hypothetical protein